MSLATPDTITPTRPLLPPSSDPMDAVHKRVIVAAPLDLTFEVFTARIERWWPMASHHIGGADCAAVLIEPHVGGRWYERGTDGSECPWGEVLLWDAPNRVVLAWRISASWQFDPALHTEVDVRFTALDAGRTQVDLEHRGLSAYGEQAAAMHAAFNSPNGWNGMLDHFAAVASQPAA